MVQEWSRRKLREICDIIAGQAPPSKYYNEEGKGIPFLTVNSFGRIYPKIERWTTKCLKESKEGDVLFSVAGSLGLVNLGINACVTRSIFALRPNQNLVLQKFLFYALKKYGSQIASMGGGTAQKVITINQISEFEIPLPPLPIQQKIVKILDTIQEAIDIQDKIIEKTKELKKSLMAELFKYGAPSFRKGRKLKKTEIGEIPEDWEVVRLGDKKLFEIKLGGTPNTSVSEYWNGEIPWITPNDLSQLRTPYIENTQRKISILGLKVGSTLLPENSIILSTRAPIGYVALLRRPMAFNQGCKGIVIKDKSVVSVFLYYFLLSKIILLQELGTGSTFRELATSDLENFKIPLPPLPEQKEIAEILQTVDQKIDIERRKKELYEELFKTVLNKIMNQEIDVESVDF
ncbi:MAG: restriction endonuclease subunit S [Caldimicrobium sp.]|nr:restriction endonuclease subunit S [Caldimicrobium sp.]